MPPHGLKFLLHGRVFRLFRIWCRRGGGCRYTSKRWDRQVRDQRCGTHGRFHLPPVSVKNHNMVRRNKIGVEYTCILGYWDTAWMPDMRSAFLESRGRRSSDWRSSQGSGAKRDGCRATWFSALARKVAERVCQGLHDLWRNSRHRVERLPVPPPFHVYTLVSMCAARQAAGRWLKGFPAPRHAKEQVAGLVS